MKLPRGTLEQRHPKRLAIAWIFGSLFCISATCCFADEPTQKSDVGGTDPKTALFRRDVKPLLEQYCYGCHAEGGDEGNFILDEYPSEAMMLADSEMWWSVLKNVRSDIMPPEGEDRPSKEEAAKLNQWIIRYAFGSADGTIDPGKTVLRRLNRLEYRNTIRDLMGVEFDTSVEFPPDDSGDGFDNNADALSISPLLAEKYLQAAQQIVQTAVPTSSRVLPVNTIKAETFEIDPQAKSPRLDFESASAAEVEFPIEIDSEYRVALPFEIRGSFNFHPSRARVLIKLDDEVVHDKVYGWRTDFMKRLTVKRRLGEGLHKIRFEVIPIEDTDSENKKPAGSGTFVRLELPDARIEGPLDRQYWSPPANYSRFFHLDDAPIDANERASYAKEVLRRFCRRAFRRPADDRLLVALVELAGLDEDAIRARSNAPDESPSRSFETSIARAMAAVLASPRFLFRTDIASNDDASLFPRVDDHTLASRLSYYFWSTMPDETLMDLADRGELRENLKGQTRRMLADPRSDALIKNFSGQWLQTRDVESVSIDPLAALGVREEYENLRDYLETTKTGRRDPPKDAPPEHLEAYKRYREIRALRGRLDANVRRDMRAETERLFAYVLKENRSLLELLDSDYAFLNERLAKHYGIPAIKGDQIRRVDLPDDSQFGGVLTQGTFLLVTSNPTRTSPVKRGLFILDNILGTPAPPAPAEVPELEQSADRIDVANPTLRQILELHRSEPLCRSCHARFDPLGLAFENFTALGTWRDEENGAAIESGGQLISGESFDSVGELKRILAGPRRQDFYRCVSERMLSYAIGRGLDFRDEVAMEDIVQRLEREQGSAGVLIEGVVESPLFLRMRRPENQRLSTESD